MESCLIYTLKKLKESSKEAVENINQFSDFKKYMHVKRNVENELFNLIDRSNKSSSSKLILVCGGVGDGKSHIISYFKNNYGNLMDNFNVHNDATESFEPTKTSTDTLNDVLKNFNDNNLGSSNEKLIIAINLGALNNFIDSKYKDNFSKLIKFVENKKILDLDIIDNSYDENSNFQFINFSDYHLYSLTEEGPKSSYIKSLIEKITSDNSDNVFKNSYDKNCLKCENSFKCPVKINFEMLKKESVVEKLIDMIIKVIIKDKLIISTRSLFNFIHDFLVNIELDNKNENEVRKIIQNIKIQEFINYTFASNLFNHSELSFILKSFERIDPIRNLSEDVDNVIINLNVINDTKTIMKDYINLTDENYLESILFSEITMKDAIESIKLKSDKTNLEDSFITLFIRLNAFIPNRKLTFDEDIYQSFVKDLYYFNNGNKKDLQQLYKNVKEAIYKWNGDSINSNININVGKNQRKYIISQKLDLKPNLNNIIEVLEDEIFKFNPTLFLEFKSDTNCYGVDIDFNLYSILMNIQRGYRPNKNDRYNYIGFVEFMNKIQNLGSQNKEIFIKEIGGINFKLSYDSDFDTFEFKREV